MTESEPWTNHPLFNINNENEVNIEELNDIDELNEQIQLLKSKYDKALKLKEEKKEKKKEETEEIKSCINGLDIDSIANIIFDLQLINKNLEITNEKLHSKILSYEENNNMNNNSKLFNNNSSKVIFQKVFNNNVNLLEHPLYDEWNDTDVNKFKLKKTLNEKFNDNDNFKIDFQLQWNHFENIPKIIISIDTFKNEKNQIVTYIIFTNSDDNLTTEWFQKIQYYIKGNFINVLDYLIESKKIEKLLLIKKKPELKIQDNSMMLPFYIKKNFIDTYVKVLYSMISNWKPPQ